ncbi:SCP2 sterol-binding domain-containing protein [Solwaraspora sp. WMMD1047]|uniref:SCP2 sterol-binding domain-containing protein n=1 Tax=Solwaraspora sp. WMMD1047 TaxID=3016102 RepID=UPI002417A3B0|nr:SCP2 sterol-binding domain-containing protein [Solwaraspora sp. WMMD1047]MDG4834433.1 SCP2 sterol-binding domain-containing protein [Solwaraspora sp. WMMD1047]
MTDDVDTFLGTLGERSPGRLPPTVRGTIDFEVVRPAGESHWLVTLADGRATAVPHQQPADCSVRISAESFSRLIAGQDHIVSMLFRDCVAVEGDLALFLIFRRLLPEPADSRGPVPSMNNHVARSSAERNGSWP